jgi:hypothetical protein
LAAAGATNTFLVRTEQPLGQVTRVMVTSDGSGLGPAWHLESVEVVDMGSGQALPFPCGRWAGLGRALPCWPQTSASQWPLQLRCLRLPMTQARYAAAPGRRWLDPAHPASLQQTLTPAGSGEVGGGPAVLLQYEVVVFTSDTRGAGTDSNVSIELVGAKDRSGALRLDTRWAAARAAAPAVCCGDGCCGADDKNFKLQKLNCSS